CHQFHTTPWTF
nr:immunoglobulin light chain junction region [Macaca mulatta]